MKRILKIFIVAVFLILGAIVIWIGKTWIDSGRTIKASDNFSKLNNLKSLEYDSNKTAVVVSIQGWSSTKLKPCNTLRLKNSTSQYVARDFTASSNYIDRAFISCRLDMHFSQDILTMYFLKYAYGGDGAYGVDEMSEYLFQKPFEDLSDEELVKIGLKLQRPSWDISSELFEARTKVWTTKLNLSDAK